MFFWKLVQTVGTRFSNPCFDNYHLIMPAHYIRSAETLIWPNLKVTGLEWLCDTIMALPCPLLQDSDGVKPKRVMKEEPTTP